MRTLIDLYVEQVVRRLPEASRPDIARELTATLTDTTDERLAADASVLDPADATPEQLRAAEREVLSELGDPARFARQYRDAPDHLIGPEVFPAFVWLLRWMVPLAALLTALVVGVEYVLTSPEPAIGQLIAKVVGQAVATALAAFGCAVLVFALVERFASRDDLARMTGMARTSGEPWTPEDLESDAAAVPSRRGDAIASLVVLVLVALLPVLPTTFFYVGHLNEGRSFVNPALWDGWLPAFYVLIALSVAMQVWMLVAGRWTTPMLAVEIVLDLIGAVFLTALLLTQQVADPVLVEAVREAGGSVVGDGSGGGLGAVVIPAVVAIWALTVWDQVVTLRQWRSDRAVRG